MAGPLGIDPNQVKNAQVTAAQQFAGATGAVGKKEVGKEKEEKKELPPQTFTTEDTANLSGLAAKPGLEEQIELQQAFRLDESQRQTEGAHTGSAGAQGKQATKSKTDAEREEQQGPEPTPAPPHGAPPHHRAGKLRKGEAPRIPPPAEHVEEALENALQSEGTAGSAVDPKQIEAMRLKSTYLYGVNGDLYTSPVTPGSVDRIFTTEKPEAGQAVPQVRQLAETSPIEAEPILEPAVRNTPIAVLHGVLGEEQELFPTR